MEQTAVRKNNNHHHQPTETQRCPHCSPTPNHVGIMLDSPDRLAKRMEIVTKALRFIQENARQDINVHDVARVVGKSRHRLDNHFRRVLGRTVAEEICRARLERAKQLLKKTHLPIPDVAAAAGFSHRSILWRILKRATGLTPLRYRKHSRRPRAVKTN